MNLKLDFSGLLNISNLIRTNIELSKSKLIRAQLSVLLTTLEPVIFFGSTRCNFCDNK